MSSLTFARTWKFNVNNLGHYVSGGAIIQNQHNLFKIKNVILGGPGKYGWTDSAGASTVAPSFWIVDHSCDSAVAGTPGDGADRWTTYDKIVWGSVAGVNSWIVLKNSNAISGKTLYWLISCENSGSDTNTLDMYISKVGFGLPYGGTNGTTAARPTATDEQRMLASTNWGAGSAAVIRFHIMMSSDGVATRIFTTRYGAFTGLWMLDTMIGTATGVEDNFIASAWGGVSGNPMDANSLSQTGQPLARTSTGSSINGVLTGVGSRYASNIHVMLAGTNRVLWNDMAQNDMVMSVGVWGTDYPARGHLGSIVDLWWGSNLVVPGQSFPGDFSRQLITMGPLIIPWNSTVGELF